MNETFMYLTSIAVVALVTALIRILPFVLFAKGDVPKSVEYLGDTLPSAIMIILVIFCLRNIQFTVSPYGLPEIVATLFIIIFQYKKGNTLLSILLGTGVYMLLVK